MSDEPSSVPFTPKRRLRSRVLLGLLGVFALCVASTHWLLTHLEHPWVKGKLEHALSSAVGTEVHYERLSISLFSGLELGGLVLATPETLRRFAPEMLRLDTLVVPVELGDLLRGELVVPEVRGGALTLSVVVTDDGRTSFAELPRTEEAAERDDLDPSSMPLSHGLDALEALSLRLGPVRLAPIVTRVFRVSDDAIVNESLLDAVALTSDGIVLGESPEGALSLRPNESDQVTLTVREPGGAGSEPTVRQARLLPRLEARLGPDRTAALSLAVDLVEQSLFPELGPVERLVRVETTVHFEPGQARTRLELRQLTLLDSMLSATASAIVEDDYATLIDAEGTVEVASLPWVLPWLSIEDLCSPMERAASTRSGSTRRVPLISSFSDHSDKTRTRTLR